MKREFKGEGALEFLDILDGTFLGRQFLTYAEKRAHTPRAAEELMASVSLRNEFIAKCQWIQQLVGKSERTKTTMEHAALIVINDEMISSVAAFKAEMFDEFMHFIAANEKEPSVLNSLMTTWVIEGRSLIELDSKSLTPAQVAICIKNIVAFKALALRDKSVITALDKDGLSPLHVIINKIKDGFADIPLLRLWIEHDLPIDRTSGKEAKNAGKTAMEFAQEFGLIEVVRILGGDIAADDSYVETALLKAVKDGNVLQVVNLALLGIGTTTLDVYKGKSYHVLNYVVTFGGSKSVKMISRLSEEKINFLHEKVEQALVHALYPIINSPLGTVTK